MSFSLTHMWATMGPLAKIIAAVLVTMAIASVGVVVERLIVFYHSAKESRRFVAAVSPLIEEWKLDEIVDVANKHKASMLARLFIALIERFVKGYESLDGGITPVERARNETERQKEVLGADLRRGLGVLASVGSVAPFVGLLGTVVGIIAAFRGIAAAGSGGLGAVSAGIAEALVETALGLLVAIPVVLLFNYLTARVAGIELTLERAAGELLDEMQGHFGGSQSRSNTGRHSAAA
jgi:biopolymer transport protein ExbB